MSNTANNIRNIICKDSNTWEIVDQDEHLSLIHYPRTDDQPQDPTLRGWVVDTTHGVILAKSYGYTPTATLDKLVETEEGITITDDHHNIVTYPKNQYGLKIGHEGAMIRVFYTGGRVRIVSHRRLSITRSKWGSSPFFQDMISQCKNKEIIEDLFDLEKKESPYCHSFLLVHPDLLCCSLEQVDEPYLLYLGHFQAYTEDECPFEMEDVDWNLKHRERMPEISLDEANRFLTSGYGEDRSKLQDPRLQSGEFVLIYNKDHSNFIKVQSKSYSWRAMICDNNPNIKHRFYQLAELVAEKHKDRFESLFPKLTDKQLESRRSMIPCLRLAIDSKQYRKLVNVWTCLWLSVPINKRQSVQEVQRNYLNSKRQLVNWLCTLERSGHDYLDLPDRIKQILTLSRFKAIQDHQTNIVKAPSVDSRVRSNINNLIRKEYGVSLYRLVKAHEKFVSEFHE